MTLEKILITVRGKQYSLTVEVMRDEDETIFRATPDQGEPLLKDIAAGYIEFDDEGNRQYEAGDDVATSSEEKEIENAVWSGIKEQILDEHPEYRQSGA